MSPYSEALYGSWEKDFILVQWDQRGTARTYGHNAPEELSPEYLQSNPLTLEQMTSDGIALARYLSQRFGNQKIILFGSSWGSVIGVRMAQRNPELFYAYIGHSQLVSPALSNLSAYRQVMQLAQKENDKETLDMLRLIGKPPYDTARNAGRFMRVIKRYQQMNATPHPAEWFVLAPEYDNEKDARHRSDGDDYSFVNYFGDKKLRVASISSNIDLFNDGLVFKIPVYLIQGEEDIQTPATINKTYFDKLRSPKKELILLPKTEHGFNQAVLDTHLSIMQKHIIPGIGDR